MSIQITFEPAGHNGLVAVGTNIWEAARRLGVDFPAECKGRGECDSCAVVVRYGAQLLSAATPAEEKLLGPDRLQHPSAPERLACQATLASAGEIRVRLSPTREGEARKPLSGQPFKEKVGSFIETEAIAITGAMNSFRDGYHSLIGKFLNLNQDPTKEAAPTTKQSEQNKPGADEKR
jgi:ferredoxin